VNTHNNSNKKQTTATGGKRNKQRRLSATQMKQKPRDKAFIIISIVEAEAAAVMKEGKETTKSCFFGRF